ncbi:hypothetical protein [uncultured Photobacterium sp.]|uniref:hypothetical protein n=1 Tax=uncultured Photobacterium sp. TaxID=173973 RepID=UPI00262F500E|nr:hypothetical protein [uncultured Photobacterium sp.]
MIKHETVNSVIGVLGLMIALVTAYHQFVPEGDKIDIDVSPIPTSVPLKQHFDFQDGISDEVFKISGPFFWEFTAYNSLDRTVTIKDIDTKLFSGAGSLIDYSNITVGTFDRELKPLSLPLLIGSHEAKVILIGLNVPIISEDSCFSSQSSMSSVQRCYFEKGYDLFGNSVSTIQGGAVSWDELPKSPVFLSTVKTGDNSEFHRKLSFYSFTP